jgi:SAM-dependent methyltransferase
MNMATPWHVRLYRGYRAIVRSDRFLARRFIAEAAHKSGKPKINICLDIGAGIAPYRQAVSAEFLVNSYFALDFVPSDTINVVADATALPMHNNSVDLVVCFEALQHIPRHYAMLNEAARVLGANGYLILSIPFIFCECDVVDFRRWTTAGITQELEERGFSLISIAHRGGAIYAFINMVIWIIQHAIPGSRATWRSSRSLAAYCREAVINILTIPFTLLCWPAFLIDGLLPVSGFYAGTFVVARLDTPKC